MSSLLGTNVTSGQDKMHPTTNVSMRDFYAIQKEFISYVNLEELVPRLLTRGLLSDNEVYMVKNPYLPPDQKIFQLFQYISNKGPGAPDMFLQCLTNRPLIQGHMYLASRLVGETQQDAQKESTIHFTYRPNPIVERKIMNLKFKFADLLLETHRYLQISKVSIEEFRIYVSFMSSSSRNSSSLFFHDHLPSLSTASTIDQIFAILNENQYWNHFNYHLLEAVVRKFGDEKIQKQLEVYIDDLTAFESSVSLSQYTVSLPSVDKAPSRPDFTPVKTTIEQDWNAFSLLETRSLQKKMCTEFEINEHSLIFQSAEEGSVIITWLVPVSVEDSIVVCSRKKRIELLAFGISILEISDSVIILDETNDDYQNTNCLATVRGYGQHRLEVVVKSLEVLDMRFDQLKSDLKLHKSVIEDLVGFNSQRETDDLRSRSLSVPNSQETLYSSEHHQRKNVIPTNLPILRTPSPQFARTPTPTNLPQTQTSSPPTQTYLPSFSSHVTKTNTSYAQISDVKRISRLKYGSHDSDDEEDVSRWIQEDSGYSEPKVWTNSKRKNT